MNTTNAKTLIANLNPGMFAGRDWFGPERAIVYFKTGHARNTVADYGLFPLYNSGATTTDSVVVTDKLALKALRKAYA